MMQQLPKLLVPFVLIFEVTTGWGQSPVAWKFAAAPLRGHETTIYITAEVPPGWHLYSQSIKAGGPIPTSITFMPGDDYILQGITMEKGEAATFYDDTYEMEIIWYTGAVTFLQRLMLTKPRATIKGIVDYMTCNNEVCVPGRQTFSIDLPVEKPSYKER